MIMIIVLSIFCVLMMFHICIIKESDYNPDGTPTKADKIIFGAGAVPLLIWIIADIIDNSGTVMIDDVFILLFGSMFIWFPISMTGLNIKHLVRDINSWSADILTILVGVVYHIMLLSMIGGNGINAGMSGKPYNEAVYPDQYHEMISSEYGTIIEWVMVIGFISMILLCVRKPMKTPPLQSALCIAFTAIMLLLMGVMYIQMIKNFEISFVMFYLYYFNLIIISAHRIRYHITEQVRLANECEMVFGTKTGERLHKIMSTISGMTKFSFMLILPIAIICEILYILLGQGVDGFIKAFTMTADWTFSTQLPPPPMEYQGHYLCTVAACGHEKVVKPLRYGVRLNKRIVVNRQLLIANAFEDLIKERLPKSHRRIRKFYDTYGYPVSRHITTQTRADIVYILMKPLEWLFLALLYMFDAQPENRIVVQYSGYKIKKIKSSTK